MDPNAIVENFRNIVTKQYVDFNGRTRRREFWYFVLAYVVLYIVCSVVENILGFGTSYTPYGAYYYYSFRPLTGILSLALLLPSLGLAVRRLHDIDRSGWWVLLGIIPVIGWIVVIYWYAQPGTAGSNQFGPDPKAGETPPPPAKA